MNELEHQIERYKKEYDFSPKVLVKEDIQKLFSMFNMLFEIETFSVYTDAGSFFASGFESQDKEDRFYELLKPIYEKLFEDEELHIIYSPDASKDKGNFRKIYDEFGYKSVLVIQIITRFEHEFKKKGFMKFRKDININFNCRRAAAFDKRDIQILSSMTDLFHSKKVMTISSIIYGNYAYSVIENLPIGLLLIRNGEQISILNDAAGEILGISEYQSLKMQNIDNPTIDTDTFHEIRKLFPNAKKNGLLDAVKNVQQRENEKAILQFWYTRPDGKRIFIEAQLTYLELTHEEFNKYKTRNQAEIDNIVMIIQDITERIERYNMQKELEIARDVQRSFLPKSNYENEHVETYGLFYPAKEVGGDYYDFIPNQTESILTIAIADVTGKGVSSAMVMSSLQTSLRMLIEVNNQFKCLKCIATYLNNLVYKNTPQDMFITMFYGTLNLKNYEFTYCNAGHNYPILIRNTGETQLLKTGGLVLGVLPHADYNLGKFPLEKGDMILCYTDGIVEAVNEKDEEFGEDRLMKVIQEKKDSSPKELVERIINRVNQYKGSAEQYDDITIFAVKMK